jgi:hypothetical protein
VPCLALRGGHFLSALWYATQTWHERHFFRGDPCDSRPPTVSPPRSGGGWQYITPRPGRTTRMIGPLGPAIFGCMINSRIVLAPDSPLRRRRREKRHDCEPVAEMGMQRVHRPRWPCARMIKVFSITSGSKGGQPSRLTIKGPLHLGAVEFQLPQGADGYFSQIADTLSPAHHSIGQPEQVRELPLGSEDRFSRDCLQEGRSPCPAKPYPAYLLPLRFPPSVVEPVVHPPPGRLFAFPTHSNFAS